MFEVKSRMRPARYMELIFWVLDIGPVNRRSIVTGLSVPECGSALKNAQSHEFAGLTLLANQDIDGRELQIHASLKAVSKCFRFSCALLLV